MKKGFLYLTCIAALVFSVCSVYAQLNVVRIQESKIFDEHLSEVWSYLKSNQSYCDHWTKDWVYPAQKSKLIHSLRGHYSVMMGYQTDEPELQLMMGLTAHFLYNLDDTSYFNLAIAHFKSALSLTIGDGRPMWALAKHYALAGQVIEGWYWIEKARESLGLDDQKEFWNDYAMLAAMANMPVHSIFGMEQHQRMHQKPSYFEEQLGESVKQRIVRVNADSSYLKEQIWFLRRVLNIDEYTCFPLGMRMKLDSSTSVTVYDYDKRQNAVLIEPKALADSSGRIVNMSILMLMCTASEMESLKAYMDKIGEGIKGKKVSIFPCRWGDLMAFEIRDTQTYPELGGGHMWLVGLERAEPSYPGFLFEEPSQPRDIGGALSSEVQYYQPQETIGRFSGKIQYLFLLDTGESIYAPSLEVFTRFLNEQLILE